MSLVKVGGFDPGFGHFGWAQSTIDLDTMAIDVKSIGFIKTEKSKTKGVYVSADDFRRIREIHKGLSDATQGLKILMSEIPSGGAKSHAAAKAMSYSTCLIACTMMPVIQITPRNVKICATGNPNASKEEMIEWAVNLYPDLAWTKAKSKNEHMADAIGAIHAGVETEEFLNLTALIS